MGKEKEPKEEKPSKKKGEKPKPSKSAEKKGAPQKPEEKKAPPEKRPEPEPHPPSAPEAVEKAEEAKKEEQAPPKQEAPLLPPPVEYENDSLKVAVHKKPACRIELHIKASPKLVKEAHGKAVRTVSKRVSFPGFRKGKAPFELVMKNYPKDVDKYWQQSIADLAFKEGQSLAKVPLLDTEAEVQFKMQAHSLDGGADLMLAFETTPEPPVVDPKAFKLKKVDVPTVDQKKIDEAIHQVRFFFAKWKPAADRPVQEGDYLLIDLEGIDTDPAQKVYTNTRFEVSDQRMAKWMKDLVIGMRQGESKEGVSEPDASATEEEKKEFLPKKVRITVNAIQEVELPPLDEKFAENLGVKNLEEVRASVEKILQKQVDDHIKSQQREQASDFLLNENPFELPPTLVQKEARFRMEQLGKDPKFLQFWQGISEKERQNVAKEIYAQAEKAVRLFYLCRKIVSDAKMTITADDVAKKGITPLEILLQPSPESHFAQDSDIGHSETYSRLMMQKAEDYLILHAGKE